MNIYFDCEFTGLRKDTSLISIGFVSENGEEFYYEFEDYDKNQCDDWIKNNVLNNTVFLNLSSEEEKDRLMTQFHQQKKNYWCGTKENCRQLLEDWFEQFRDVQLVSDVCHYDMMLFIDLFGTPFDLPDNVSPVCYDINQDISLLEGVSEREAFDINREEFLEEHNKSNIIDKDAKHNSLYDAKIIKEIYNVVKG